MTKWYLIHTRQNWERKVVDYLEQKGIESYCPVKKVRRKWSDRIKTIEEPLFKAHVFVKIAPEQKAQVRMTDGVVNFAYLDGKASQIKERDIQALKKNLDNNIELITKDESTAKNVDSSSRTFGNFLNRFTNWVIAHADRPRLV